MAGIHVNIAWQIPSFFLLVKRKSFSAGSVLFIVPKLRERTWWRVSEARMEDPHDGKGNRTENGRNINHVLRTPFPTWEMTSVLAIFLRRCHHRRTDIRAAAAAVLFLDTTLLCDRRLGPGCGPGLWARESTTGRPTAGVPSFFCFFFLFLFFASCYAVAFHLLSRHQKH